MLTQYKSFLLLNQIELNLIHLNESVRADPRRPELKPEAYVLVLQILAN